jgi:hypothetical protein
MATKKDLERIFGGRDNEIITEELIKEILLSPENVFTEDDLRFFQKEGYKYCRPRKSFIGGHSVYSY